MGLTAQDPAALIELDARYPAEMAARRHPALFRLGGKFRAGRDAAITAETRPTGSGCGWSGRH